MKTPLLFPHKFKPIGWILLFPSLALGFMNMYYDFEFKIMQTSMVTGKLFGSGSQNLTNEVALVGVLVSLLIIGFSKLKVEDEYSQKIRLDSLLWATYVNFALVVVSTLFIYGMDYLYVLVYNLFTLPLFFVIRFHLFLVRR